ncbi:MBOAT family protein [Clostridium sp. 19966]|uniref:MBOAT family O-acyltransferase n=1 Tax=Clostridium sp. 19966 TaxID=2768166 RepID=UPI0028E0503B|nr:MBOAT family protein [Clostridium sp. 19966]MDT8718864.1 MBOAT family protein [Clostridium sp. 19966]
MLFSSVVFILYFLPIALILYYGTFFSKTLQNIALLLLSLAFYAWGEPSYVLLMVGSIIFNYVLGHLIFYFKSKKKYSKYFLILGTAGNLGSLFIFKYLAFVVRNLNQLQSHQIAIPNIALPIGISFFTFKAVSYLADIYRGKSKAEKNPLYVGLYIALFPELLAGPISRYEDIKNQIKKEKITWQKFSVGTCRFVTGMGKKLLISNSMAVIVDRIFQMNSNSAVTVTLAWLGAIAYTLQIYFDFSGYSDMAIGIGLMFGFKFEENFNYPYISKSITEFWRRWHISLSLWFKDYLYFPLGGSRVKNKDKLIRNLFIVWVSTGVWHGAEWTFIIWGFLNFIFIAFEKLISFDELEIPAVYRHIYALFVINLGWVIFRANNILEAGNYIASMFGFRHNGFWSPYTFMFIKENLIFIIAAIVLSTPIARKTNKFIVDKAFGYRVLDGLYPFAIVGLFLVCMSYIVKGSYNPFIYFKF